MSESCEARVLEPPWYLRTHACDKPAKYEIAGAHVCGIHKRVVDRWVNQGRGELMVETYWKKAAA